ncbi:MAG TPA: right-handed parallel beta-helix repeat-containing protein [Kouleothrix sp.]|nr:right-handed parallel beta-helix repeat-containing protein [Kouleothrix sp.]
MQSTDTIEIPGGVYPLLSPQIRLRGTVRAAPGARVVFVAADGTAPGVEVQNGAIVDGIWFGGTKQPADRPFIIKNDVTVRNCTLFGYYGGIVEGGGARNTIQGCRFVHCGTDALWHAIYISNGAADHWTLIEDCVFLGGSGYGTQLWHGPSNVTIRRNVYAAGEWMLVAQGNGHCVESNVFWSNRGGATGMLGVFLAAGTYNVRNNLFGSSALRAYTTETTEATMDGNVFYADAPGRFGTNQRIVTGLPGIAPSAVDQAITDLLAAFAQPATHIQADPTIDALFAVCTRTVDAALGR